MKINRFIQSIIATSKLEKKFDVTIREDREGNVMVEKGVMDKDLGIDNKKLKEKKKL